MPGKFCCNCTNWENVKGSKDSQGICHDVMVASNVTIEHEKTFTQDGQLWTNGYFGCIYWRENDGSIVDFEDIIDEDGNPIDEE